MTSDRHRWKDSYRWRPYCGRSLDAGTSGVAP